MNMNTAPCFFITGTGTDVGKTFCSVLILHALKQRGLQTFAIKPIACGADVLTDSFVNSDALALQQAATVKQSYARVNPFLLTAATSPNIACQLEGKELNAKQVAAACQVPSASDFCLIEGAGGWLVPLNDSQTLADVVKELAIPTIMVVGMVLGCLNQALLTAQAIARDGIRLAGWIANSITADMEYTAENIQTLTNSIAAPCLGVIPYAPGQQPSSLSPLLNLDGILTMAAAKKLTEPS